MQKKYYGDIYGYHQLLEYLSEKTGIPVYEKLSLIYRNSGTLYAMYQGHEVRLGGTTLKGGIPAYTIIGMPANKTEWMNLRIPKDDHDFDEVYVKRRRTHNEFGLDVELKPNAYKYDEGNGWSSWQDVYIIDGFEFINP